MDTVSVFRACAGGYVGGGHVHPALLDAARESLSEAKSDGLVADGYIARCGDDIGLVVLHGEPAGSPSIQGLADDLFGRAADAGRRLRQFGVNGQAPEIQGTEISFEIRDSEPVLCFLSDKAGPGAWNVHLYRMFADPFNSPGLVTDDALREGFSFAATNGQPRHAFSLPGDLYRFLEVARSPGACVLEVRSNATGELGAVASNGRDPVLIVRCGAPFPSVEEVLEAFTVPYAFGATVAGTTPLVPVSANGDTSTRALGKAVGLGFQVAPGRLVGPRDVLGDPAFDAVRRDAVAAGDYLRRHGPFTPARSGL